MHLYNSSNEPLFSLNLLPSLFIYFSSPTCFATSYPNTVPGTSSAARRAPVHSQTDTCLYAVRVSSDSSASLPDGIDTLRTFADYSSGGCVPPADRVISGPAAADVLANRILAVDVPRYHYCQGQPAGCECRCEYNIFRCASVCEDSSILEPPNHVVNSNGSIHTDNAGALLVCASRMLRCMHITTCSTSRAWKKMGRRRGKSGEDHDRSLNYFSPHSCRSK